MKQIFELEIWTRPGDKISLNFNREIQNELDDLVGKDIVFGQDFLPDETDIRNLKKNLLNSCLTKEEFREFCLGNGYEANVINPNSAARFLEYMYGVSICWVHLPYSNEGFGLYSEISSFVYKKKLNLQGEDSYYCELLSSEKNQHPIGWEVSR
jgi:hypothetical protein